MREQIIYCQPTKIPEDNLPADNSGARFWRDFTPKEETERLAEIAEAEQRLADEEAKQQVQEEARARVIADPSLIDVAIGLGWVIP